MNVFNTETRENLGQIDDIKEVNITSERKTDYARDKHGNNAMAFNHNPIHTMIFNTNLDESIDKEGFYKILGIDASNMPDAYDVQFIKVVRSRRHRNKRINKKWLKRYGYRQILVESKGWKIKADTDGNVEFIK